MTVNCLPANSLISEKLFTDKQHRSYVIASSSPSASTDLSENPSNSYDVDAQTVSPKFKRTTDAMAESAINIPTESLVSHKRVKRLHIFRPLFVYRHQQLKKRRLTEERRELNRERRLDELREDHLNELRQDRLNEIRHAYFNKYGPPCSYPDRDCAY